MSGKQRIAGVTAISKNLYRDARANGGVNDGEVDCRHIARGRQRAAGG
jgi:hypothetical protein